MSDPIEEKTPFPKCADAIEFGSSFGKFSRVSDKQFVILLNEKRRHLQHIPNEAS